MKEVLRNEIFSSTKEWDILSDTNVFNVFAEGVPRCDSSEKGKDIIRKVICRNLSIQKALVEELVHVKCFEKGFDSVNVNYPFFVGKLCNAEELLADLKAIYGVIWPITDRNQKLVGYYVSNTSPQALISVKELYDENRIDSLILRFLSLAKETQSVKNHYERFLLMEKTTPPQQYDFNAHDDNFYKIIKGSLKYAGIYSFMTNKFNEKELEKDCYIQKLIELGHKVYVCKYEDENYLNVYVK